MIAGYSCDCLICRLEKNLIAALEEDRACADYRTLVSLQTELSRFSSPVALIRELHSPAKYEHSPGVDLLLTRVLRENARGDPHPIWGQILLLLFIPTIHRTSTQIVVSFSSLARDDVSQHVLTMFLEILTSHDLKARNSHIAFTIARALRRRAFRWAIQESRGFARDDLHLQTTDGSERVLLEAAITPQVLLHEYLDACQRAGLLSARDRALLIAFKIEGVPYAELARRNGHTAIAIKRRVQRTVERLRRIAMTNALNLPKQLELFTE
jgi:DNA-directed RNA polymerase specialized sigma24 family protein